MIQVVALPGASHHQKNCPALKFDDDSELFVIARTPSHAAYAPVWTNQKLSRWPLPKGFPVFPAGRQGEGRVTVVEMEAIGSGWTSYGIVRQRQRVQSFLFVRESKRMFPAFVVFPC